jgi:hypothetical protein
MAASGKKAGSIAGSRKFEPLRWRHYAAIPVAPLRRNSGGAITPKSKWLHIAESSQTENGNGQDNGHGHEANVHAESASQSKK